MWESSYYVCNIIWFPFFHGLLKQRTSVCSGQQILLYGTTVYALVYLNHILLLIFCNCLQPFVYIILVGWLVSIHQYQTIHQYWCSYKYTSMIIYDCVILFKRFWAFDLTMAAELWSQELSKLEDIFKRCLHL